MLRRFLADEAGATAIEYGLIAALVALGALTAMTLAGGSTTALFNFVSDTAIEALSQRL